MMRTKEYHVLPDVLQVASLIVESPLTLVTLELGFGWSF